jgi:hypothetical protein
MQERAFNVRKVANFQKIVIDILATSSIRTRSPNSRLDWEPTYEKPAELAQAHSCRPMWIDLREGDQMVLMPRSLFDYIANAAGNSYARTQSRSSSTPPRVTKEILDVSLWCVCHKKSTS